MKRLENWNKYGLAVFLVLLNAAFFAFIAWFMPIRYEQNDDIMMCMIANGLYTGTPDAHLVYINALSGQLLVWLYTCTHAIEWYTVIFAGLHILSMSVIDYTVLRSNHSGYLKALWLAFLYVMWIRIIISFQFTTTAGLVCLAGILLLMRQGWRNLLLGSGLVLVASLIRFHSAALVSLLMAPVVVYHWGRDWRRYVPMIVLFMLVIGGRVGNRMYYQSDEWKYYREYNTIRANMTDNPNARTRRVFNNLPDGVTEADYRLFLNFFPDPNIMDLEALKQINTHVNAMPLSQKLMNIERLSKYGLVLLTMLILMIMVDLSQPEKKMHLFIAGYAMFVIGLLILVSLDQFVKNRVFLCFVVPIVMAFFTLLPEKVSMKRVTGMAALIMVLIGVYIYQAGTARDNDYYHRTVVWNAFQDPLIKTLPAESRLATIGTTFSLEFINPFHIKDFNTRKFTLGWFTHIPFNKEVGESYMDLTRDDMYIFVPFNYDDVDSMINRVRQQIAFHYGVPTYVALYRRNGGYAIVQLRTTENWAEMEGIWENQ